MLIENIKLFLGADCPIIDRVLISDGVIPSDEMIVNGRGYERDSFVPKTWRVLSQAEEIILHAETEYSPGFSNHVGIVKLTEGIIQQAKDLGFQALQSEEELINLRKKNTLAYIQFIKELKDFIGGYCLSNDKIHQIGWVINKDVNKKTVTVNFQTGKHLGLHMDSWEGLPLAKLSEAPNRICINFGAEARYLLFVNLTMQKIYELTKDFHEIDINSVGQDLLTITFFKHFPQYPVFRVKVNPYEAYIAPTENMIHDGNTEGLNSIDVHYTVRGYFNSKTK